jgi:hypothetical protein
MKNILLTTFLLFTCTAYANTAISDLKVNPNEKEEFKKPLPELYIFNANNECIYRGYGFSDEAALFINLDYLFGIPNDELPNGIVKSKFVADFMKTNPSLEPLPKEQQEEIISQVLAEITSQILPKTCPMQLDKIYETLIDSNGKPYIPKEKQGTQFVVIEYSADWCLPCKQLESGLNKYIETRKTSIAWLKVERDAQNL